MLDDAPVGASPPVPRCTWCSAELPSDNETICPSCGATLTGTAETSALPGVTAIDAEAIIRARVPPPKQRGRLMSWISGEYDEPTEPAPPGSLEPPPLDVRREMLRLELEAETASLQAEVDAMEAERLVEAANRGRTRPTATPAGDADAASAELPVEASSNGSAPPPLEIVAAVDAGEVAEIVAAVDAGEVAEVVTVDEAAEAGEADDAAESAAAADLDEVVDQTTRSSKGKAKR